MLPTTDQPPTAATGASTDTGQTATISADSTLTATSNKTSYDGKIAGLESGGIFVLQTATSGKVPIAVTGSTTVNTYRAPLSVGSYAIAVGSLSGSTLEAAYVALYPTAPTTVTIAGTVTGTTPSGFDVRTSTSGIVPVMVSDATTGSYTVGSSASVTGIGSTAVAVLARTVDSSTSTSSTPEPVSVASTVTSGIPLHVMTGDYLGTPWGSTSVSPSTASRYLNWVRTAAANGNAMHAAGLKVQMYVDPNRVQTDDPLYTRVASSGFAKTCASSRVYDKFAGITQYVTSPGNTYLREAYDALVAADIAGQHVDAVFEDNAGPIEYDGVAFSPGMPCSYSDSAWLSGERSLEASLSIPTIFNGLSAFYDHGVSQSIGLLSNSKTIGGEIEHCFTSGSSAVQGSWPWTATEDTQLRVTALDKDFQCQALDSAESSSSVAARLYVLASFLMTYNRAYSSLWEDFGTPSGVHVMPESQLVPTDPVVSTPSSIASLARGTGTYVREYRDCYYAGKLVGACAMVVNMDYVSHPRPSLSLAYHHTLALSGYGVLDGGKVSFAGSAPPSTMAAESAFIALP